MSETDSFIEEVTEEVRRDKLFLLFRKYGWIAGVVIFSIVGGAAYNEWRKASQTAAAQALGDAVTAALDASEASERAAALAAITTDVPGTAEFIGLIQAAALMEGDDKAAAIALLDDIVANPDTPELYRSLAQLKAVILRGADQEFDARVAVLDQLAVPGSPFRVVAMEQKALAYVQNGNNSEAINLLTRVLEEPLITQALRQRAQQLIVALGGTLSDEG